MLERGCRQGDPISPYLFVRSTEILSTVIRECRGLMVGAKETKISMYADDTTLFLKADKDTVKKKLDVFHWFKKVSGLSINIEKN